MPDDDDLPGTDLVEAPSLEVDPYEAGCVGSLESFGLSDKKRLFVLEYCVDRNGSAAAKRAGYRNVDSSVAAYQLLRQPQIRAAVDAELARLSRATRVTAERVLTELGELAYSNMKDYLTKQPDGSMSFDFEKVTSERFSAISEYTVDEYLEATADGKGRTVKRTKIKLHDKRAALVDLGRHLSLFKDRLEVQHAGIVVHLNAEDSDL